MERFKVPAKFVKMVNICMIKAEKRQMVLIHYHQMCVKETVERYNRRIQTKQMILSHALEKVVTCA